MKQIITAVLLALLIMISTQCRKEHSIDNSNNGNGDSIYVSKAPITATLQGNITDENGQPSSGVTITVGAKIATTDNNGYFRITAAALDKQASFVTAQKTGYFNAYRSFCATSGTNQIAIQLIKKTLAGSVSAASGGTVTLSNGSKIALPANGVVNASSNVAYSGTINVYAAYIDPSDNSIAKTIPGSFMANDKNNNRVTLASYGMLAVELQSSDGQKLQIASGNTATLTTPIPTSLQTKAPATISMWYLNEQTALWQEEGSATKNGSNYIGTVKHFSFWNCDYPYPTVQLSATIKTSDGFPLTYSYIELRYADTTTYSYEAGGWTDSLGVVSGSVPVNANLILEVLDQCFNVIYSKNIGAISSNTDLGTITVPNNTVGITTITGKLVTCNNTPVSNGYVVINFQYFSQYVQCNSSGDFSANFIECPNVNTSCYILGYDNTTHLQGNTITIPVTTTITDVGNITACGNSTPYYITIKGKLVDCNNLPVSNGTAFINYPYYNIVTSNSSGEFSTKLYYYPNNYPDNSTICYITGINTDTRQQGDSILITLASLQNDTLVNAGNIIACGIPIPINTTYILDGVNYPLFNPISSFYDAQYNTLDSTTTPSTLSSYVSISASSFYQNASVQFNFQYTNTNPGTYPVTYLNVAGFDNIKLIQPFNVTITKFAQSIGDNYEGSFSGQFTSAMDNNQTIHTISCTFKQPRTQ